MLRKFIQRTWNMQNFKFFIRNVANDQPPTTLSEQKLTEILKSKFKGDVNVSDVSGGCGAMFEVHVKSPEFKNLTLVKQHQMVNAVLKEEVKQMHGIRIFTESQ